MKKECKPVKEDAPTNSVGSGSAVAGLGVGPQGEPGIKKKKKIATFISFMRRKTPVSYTHLTLPTIYSV